MANEPPAIPDEQTDGEVLPILGRKRQAVGRDRHQDHLNEKNNATAEAVGQNAERQT